MFSLCWSLLGGFPLSNRLKEIVFAACSNPESLPLGGNRLKGLGARSQ
jgi:hypothetical protein